MPQDIDDIVRSSFAAPVARQKVVVRVRSKQDIIHYLLAIKRWGPKGMNTSVAPAAPSLATLLATGCH